MVNFATVPMQAMLFGIWDLHAPCHHKCKQLYVILAYCDSVVEGLDVQALIASTLAMWQTCWIGRFILCPAVV